MSLTGSCLCGRVRYEIRGQPIRMSYCHCSRCRKASGSAFGTTILVQRKDFQWLRGEELIAHYVPDPPFALVRSFCRICGAYLGEIRAPGDRMPIAAGTLDCDPEIRPAFHENVESKAPWLTITDELPQIPGIAGEDVARR